MPLSFFKFGMSVDTAFYLRKNAKKNLKHNFHEACLQTLHLHGQNFAEACL